VLPAAFPDQSALTFRILVTTRDQERIARGLYPADPQAAPAIRGRRSRGLPGSISITAGPSVYESTCCRTRWYQSSVSRQRAFFLLGQPARRHTGPNPQLHGPRRIPAIDHPLIAALLEAREPPAFLSAVRARTGPLMFGLQKKSAIPLFKRRRAMIAPWNRIEKTG